MIDIEKLKPQIVQARMPTIPDKIILFDRVCAKLDINPKELV